MGVHANLLIACTQVAGETGLTGIVIFLTEIEPQHGIDGPKTQKVHKYSSLPYTQAHSQ